MKARKNDSTASASDGIRALLTRAAANDFDSAESDWRELLRTLHFDLGYYPAVLNVLKHADWSSAKDPLAFVRVAAQREARRLGISDDWKSDRRIEPEPGEHIEECIDRLCYEGDMIVRNGVHRQVDDSAPEPTALRHVDESFFRPAELASEGRDVDWDKVAQTAGLDEVEREVLRLRVFGFSRTQVLEITDDEVERKQLQAAWRRITEKKDLLAAILTKPPAKP